jgi:hypothetical protein
MVSPGEHDPAHLSPEQTLVQVVVWLVPVLSHVCSVLLSKHVAAPGEHIPPQALPTHAKGHAVGFAKVPMLLHVWMVLLSTHDVVPGEQVPLHTPPTQAFIHVVVSMRVPVSVQV